MTHSRSRGIVGILRPPPQTLKLEHVQLALHCCKTPAGIHTHNSEASFSRNFSKARCGLYGRLLNESAAALIFWALSDEMNRTQWKLYPWKINSLYTSFILPVTCGGYGVESFIMIRMDIMTATSQGRFLAGSGGSKHYRWENNELYKNETKQIL